MERLNTPQVKYFLRVAMNNILSLSLFLSLSPSLSLSLSPSLPISLSPSLPLSPSLSFSPSLPPSLPLSLSLSTLNVNSPKKMKEIIYNFYHGNKDQLN